MSDNLNQQGEPTGEPKDGEPKDGDQPKTFTQEEVNKLIGTTRTDERRKASEKFGDYEDLKAAAAAKKTSDERIAELENLHKQSETNTLRLRVAGDYSISTKRGENGEPSDAELFLTGTDEDTLVAQAKRLAAHEEERKKNQPYVSREGGNIRPKPDSTKDFLNVLTGRDQ